ncbi:hypothetical protein [Brucella anthropi]|uniref:hypothetical protein n=1 Tax=Brucella anthropi TaxID=529 RepID=UPI00124F5EC4|nr:hypothetical protein [Brucella anthropi]KAB2751764.1 hypothetical protein F9L05_01105 [Brucella anthropi]
MMHFGYEIHVCAPGTVIKNTNGQELTVTENNAVISGKRMYVTPDNNRKLIEKTVNAPFPHPSGGDRHGE